MSFATLLLREDSTTSLSTLVDKAQQKKPPHLEYEIHLNSLTLEFHQLSKNDRTIKSSSTDEGFESDIDSLSIVSSDDSFSSGNLQNGSKSTETDSANGSASSDSDTDTPTSNSVAETAASNVGLTSKNVVYHKEVFNLVESICYTDVKCPNILVFVLKKEAFVFKFDNLNNLQNFFRNFTTLKAVTNQKAYNKTTGAKFNLLQRTDNNGVTHIEITREPNSASLLTGDGPSSIISLNTPEGRYDATVRSKTLNVRSNKESKVNTRQRSESSFNNDGKFNTMHLKTVTDSSHKIDKSASSDNILELNDTKELVDIKIWNSAEDLLDTPRRPERRKKVKGRAPQPPINLDKKIAEEKQDVYSGQYVKVSVNFDPAKDRLLMKSGYKEPHPKKLQNFSLLTPKSNLPSLFRPKTQTYQQFKYSDPKKIEMNTLSRGKPVTESSWTNSVPRLLKKHRSKSETRNFTPMAYRYIDTTQNYPVTYTVQPTTPRLTSNVHGPPQTYSPNLHQAKISQNIGNRLFGLSPKLRDFGSNNNETSKIDTRWNSLGELSYKDSNLKSVIKKDEPKKKNEKKVTFSAYTTVQVV